MNATGTQTRISLKNILFPTDFSLAAAAALPYAKSLAKQFGATIHAVHVRTPYYPIVGPEGLPQIMEAEEEQAKLDAQQLNETMADVSHVVSVGQGDVWTMIDKILTKQNIDLIVLGTWGRSGIARAILGSVAEEVFRKASCPVLTVGPHISNNTERRLKMKEILFATDFSPESLSALPYAISLAQENQARLTLLHVLGPPEVGDLVLPEDCVKSTLHLLQDLVPLEARSWCEPNTRVEKGPAADKILEVATALGADLIVLGVRCVEGHLGAATHLFRATAHQVVAQAECPVLTVRG